MTASCAHGDATRQVAPSATVCETCVETGDTWVHLRQCMTCGRTLCCDSSPNQHMSKHCRAAAHPVMRGADPGDDWAWCTVDEEMLRQTAGGWLPYEL